ncbi:MAG: hypothetical protein DLM68_00910 [Hyphomicrobiales bacterium]|nr:MAG: hypothetical protein DLM68_00910 [Hyphomicrobiales bacterium]
MALTLSADTLPNHVIALDDADNITGFRPSLEMVDTSDKLLMEVERCLMGTTRRQFTEEFKLESLLISP